ncbi:hypothetical protein PV783_18530 [Chitinophaga sp. CC14]|uniref:hypothetical protein n=1 Tax=Chitinophaga sp. CC14 TaxID=3029199 RepID=UPI003B7E6556
MKNKTIVVPKNKDAEIALDYDRATPEQLIEMTLDETMFKELWEAGIFDRINNIAGVNIDIYEDEYIAEIEKLEKVLASDIFTANLIDSVKRIKSLFEEAVKRETGIYFYF